MKNILIITIAILSLASCKNSGMVDKNNKEVTGLEQEIPADVQGINMEKEEITTQAFPENIKEKIKATAEGKNIKLPSEMENKMSQDKIGKKLEQTKTNLENSANTVGKNTVVKNTNMETSKPAEMKNKLEEKTTNTTEEKILVPIKKQEVLTVEEEQNINEQKAQQKSTTIETPSKTVSEQPKSRAEELSHSLFSILLQKYVSADGVVDYKGFKSSEGQLDSYLNHLQRHPVKSDWARNKKLAYWINAYNAATIKLILDNYPVKSIMDIAGGKPWDKKWIKLGDKTYTLNEIENDIIRPEFNEPRIHFAVNCGAKSCPPLMNKAWKEKELERGFSTQTRKFVSNVAHNSIDEKSAKISKIFEWYAKDFGNLIDFLNTYSATKLAKNATIEYGEYDWSLNGK